MKKSELTKAMKNVLEFYGFKKRGNSYYYSNKEIICVFYLQKSLYDELYYLNLGYHIIELHPKDSFPKTYQCDIDDRVILRYDNVQLTEIRYNDLDYEKFKESLIIFIEEILLPIIQRGLCTYLEIYPNSGNCLKLRTKSYFGIK